MTPELIRRLHLALPKLRLWVDALLAAHAAEARRIQSFGFKRLVDSFPSQLLEHVRVVPMKHAVPYPPVAALNLPEFELASQGERLGVTFLQTFFVLEGSESEALFFHELVHVVQWSRLGFDRFMLAYAYGLATSTYRDSPLEKMAYSLEERFAGAVRFSDLIGDIDHQCDAIWRQAAPVVGPSGV